MANTFNPLDYAVATGDVVDGRNLYKVDTAQAMPAILGWMSDNRDELLTAGRTPDGALVQRALGGDWLARFTLGAKQLVWIVGAVLRDYPECLELAAQPVTSLNEDEAIQRAFTIYMARLMYTEALQQAITPTGASEKAPLKDHWSRAPEWREAGTPLLWPPPINPE